MDVWGAGGVGSEACACACIGAGACGFWLGGGAIAAIPFARGGAADCDHVCAKKTSARGLEREVAGHASKADAPVSPTRLANRHSHAWLHIVSPHPSPQRPWLGAVRPLRVGVGGDPLLRLGQEETWVSRKIIFLSDLTGRCIKSHCVSTWDRDYSYPDFRCMLAFKLPHLLSDPSAAIKGCSP